MNQLKELCGDLFTKNEYSKFQDHWSLQHIKPKYFYCSLGNSKEYSCRILTVIASSPTRAPSQ